MRKTFLIVLFISLLPGCGKKESRNASAAEKNLTFKCEQKLPEFTLGPYSDPSQKELNTLCECVWGHMGGWARETSIAIVEGRAMVEGRSKKTSEMLKQVFPSRFGGLMQACGAGKL